MVCRRGGQWGIPRPDEMLVLPPGSDLFLLPGRRAAGLDPRSGRITCLPESAVAAFVAPGHTFSAHPAYKSDAKAPLLPLFAYGAVGFAGGRFYVCARRVDTDQRQQFQHIPPARIEQNARRLLRAYPGNRLISHILNNCVLRNAASLSARQRRKLWRSCACTNNAKQDILSIPSVRAARETP